MNKIFKSYMKTFIKNWVSTLFIIVFLVSLTTAIIGILASPIQIYTKLKSSEKKTVKYDQKIDLDKSQNIAYTYDFIEKYLMPKNSLNNDNSPIEKIGWFIIKTNANVGNDPKTYKDRIAKEVNNFMSSYRTSSIQSMSFETSEFKKYFGTDVDLEKILSLHIKRAIDEIINELDSLRSITPQDYNSAILGAIYKLFVFANLNELLDFSDAKTYLQVKKIDRESIKNLIDIILNNIKNKKRSKIYVMNYTLIKPEVSKVLWNNNYLHDDRIFVLEQIIKKISENKKSNYELSVSQSFKLAPSQGIFGGKNTADLRSEYSRILSSKDSYNTNKYSDVTKVLFDKNSKNTNEWNYEPESNPEVIISSAFAKANKIKIGDKNIFLPEANSSQFAVMLKFLNEKTSLKNLTESYFTNTFKVNVVGIGQNLEDFFPGPSYSSFNQKQGNYAIVYANNNFTQKYKNYEWKFLNSSESTGTLSLKIKSHDSNKKLDSQDFIFKKNDGTDFLVFKNPSSFLKKWSDSKFDKQSTNLEIRIIIFIVVSFVILLLAFLFINFNIKKEINETRKQLGIFKSSGYFTNELSWVFALKTFLLFFVSILIGFFCSFPFQKFAAKGFENSLTIHFDKIYFSPVMFIVIVFGIPLLFLFIAFLFTIKDLSEKPLSLINNSKKKAPKVKKTFLSKISEKHNVLFSWRLRKAFIKNSKGKFVIIQTLFAFSSLSYILIFGSQTLTTKIINQGFAAYNEKVDHYYDWSKSYSNYIISDEKYNLDQSKRALINLDYNDISNFKTTNEFLNQNQIENDFRYKISALTQMTINYFNDLPVRKKVEFLLPQNEVEYTIKTTFRFDIKKSDISKENQPNIISVLMDYNLNSNILKDATKEIQNTGKTDKKINPFIIDDNKRMNKITLKTISTKELQNIFYNELTQLFSIKLFQTAAIYEYLPTILGKEDPQNPGYKFTAEELIASFASTKEVEFNYKDFVESTMSKSLIQNYNPAQSKFWKTGDNNEMFKFTSSILKDTKQFTDSQIISLLYSNGLNKLSSTLSSNLLMTNASEDQLTNKMINFNTIMFDKSKEVLTSKIYLNMGDVSDESLVHAYLFSSDLNEYGDFKNAFNFSGIDSDQIQNFINPSEGIIPAIVPYFMHRDKNINVGDTIILHSNTSETIEIKVKVIGINKTETISLGYDSMMINKEAFENQYFSNELIDKKIFNQLFSHKEMLYTEMSFSNIISSFLKTINLEDNITITSDNDSKVFYEMVYGLFDATKLKNEDVSVNFNELIQSKQMTFLLTNSSFLTNYWNISVPFNVMKAAANFAIEISNRIMFVFVLLSTVILSIILLVVIGIIVDESKATILTMKALGYSKLRVNWTVMGSYIIGLVISFVTAFILSIIIWQILLYWVSIKFAVYIFLGIDYRSAMITAPIVLAVLIFGWFVANKQVEKLSLSQITNI